MELHTEIDSMSVPRSYRMCVAAVAISFRIYCVLHIHLRREIYVIFMSDQGIENIWCDVVYYNIHSVIVSLSCVLSNEIEFRWKILNDYTQATATEISMSICEISTIFQSLLWWCRHENARWKQKRELSSWLHLLNLAPMISLEVTLFLHDEKAVTEKKNVWNEIRPVSSWIIISIMIN